MIETQIYRYYAGELFNPFEAGTVGRFFWFYENKFDEDWRSREAADWYGFFKEQGLGDEFLEIVKDLEDTDSSIKSKKPEIFELWKKYLFSNKLPQDLKKIYNQLKTI